MFRIENESELLNCFRPFERDLVEVSAEMKFPLYVRDYLTWKEGSGNRTFLVVGEKTLGVVFRNDHSSTPQTNHCEWCHTEGGNSEVGMLVASASDRKKVGIHLCQRLDCLKKLESRANSSGENTRLAAKNLITQMTAFMRRTLF